MTLQVLPQAFTVCKPADAADINLNEPFCFAARTDSELSLVCPTARAPSRTLAREDGWRAFRVAGTMEFSLVGVLSRITGQLAEQGIAVFAVSTFDTDYVLVKAECLTAALTALAEDGYQVQAEQ